MVSSGGGQSQTEADKDSIKRQPGEHVGALLAGGPELHMSELRVDTPEGEVLLTLNLAIAENQVDNVSNPLALMSALSGDASIKVPQALVALASATQPQVGQQIQGALAMGFVIPKGSDYVLDAEYQGGLLTVNGNPLPLGNMGM